MPVRQCALTTSRARPSEIGAINGEVVRLSRERGLSAPYNEVLCAILRRRESTFAAWPTAAG